MLQYWWVTYTSIVMRRPYKILYDVFYIIQQKIASCSTCSLLQNQKFLWAISNVNSFSSDKLFWQTRYYGLSIAKLNDM